jgi:hypothetical protein
VTVETLRHLRVSLILEVTFFLAVYILAALLTPAVPYLLRQPVVAANLRALAEALRPMAHLPAGPRALAIWSNNLRVYLVLVVPALASLWLSRGARAIRAGQALSWICALLAVYVWVSNAILGGLVLAVDASRSHLDAGVLWLGLLPHGVLELFALSWAMAGALAAWYVRDEPFELRQETLSAFAFGVPVTIVLLGLAAGVESYVSPAVLHALAPGLKTFVQPIR